MHFSADFQNIIRSDIALIDVLFLFPMNSWALETIHHLYSKVLSMEKSGGSVMLLFQVSENFWIFDFKR